MQGLTRHKSRQTLPLLTPISGMVVTDNPVLTTMKMVSWCEDQFRDHHLWHGGAGGDLEPCVLVTAMIGDKVKEDPQALPSKTLKSMVLMITRHVKFCFL